MSLAHVPPKAFAAIISIIVAMVAVSREAASATSQKAAPHEYLVEWQQGTGIAEREKAIATIGGSVKHHYHSVSASLVKIPSDALLEKLRAQEHVVSITPNYIILSMDQSDIFYPQFNCLDCGGGGSSNQQIIPSIVSHIGASPGATAYTGAGVGVAVLDSGVSTIHRDFVRTDGSHVLSQDWGPGGNCWLAADANFLNCGDALQSMGGHGTAVAGVIGAADNSVDLVGVAPSAQIYDFNVYVNDAQRCTPNPCQLVSTTVDALDYIIAHYATLNPPIKVVNMSFGLTISPNTPTTTIEAAIAQLAALNVIPVAAAGNDPSIEVPSNTPARSPNVLAIASTTALLGAPPTCTTHPAIPADTASWYTTDGAFNAATHVGVTVSAPGEDREDWTAIGSCGNDPLRPCTTSSDCIPGDGTIICYALCRPFPYGTLLLEAPTGTMRDAGTSFSSPLVAGVVTLMEQQATENNVTLTLDSVRTKIRNTAYLRLNAPYDSPYTGVPPIQYPGYTFDHELEGFVWAPGATQ